MLLKKVYMENRELTFGEKTCGVDFNPGGNEQVHAMKKVFALMVDRLNQQREESTNQEVKRMFSVAITELQTAQMWAVKAVTWQH